MRGGGSFFDRAVFFATTVRKTCEQWVAMLCSIRSLLRFIGCCALMSAAMPVQAVNLLLNSGFPEGTAGWTVEGTVFNTGGAAVFSDQGGERAILFQTAGVPVDTTLSLVLSFDFLNALSPTVPVGGTPDSLFASSFSGSVPFGGSFAGGVFEVATGVLDADFRGSANLPPGMIVSASPKGAGWTHYRLPIPVISFVTIAFEFIDGNGVAGDSVAAVDNVVLEAVFIPEPSIPVTLLGVLGAAALRRRRRPGPVPHGLFFHGPP